MTFARPRFVLDKRSHVNGRAFTRISPNIEGVVVVFFFFFFSSGGQSFPRKCCGFFAEIVDLIADRF